MRPVAWPENHNPRLRQTKAMTWSSLVTPGGSAAGGSAAVPQAGTVFALQLIELTTPVDQHLGSSAIFAREVLVLRR